MTRKFTVAALALRAALEVALSVACDHESDEDCFGECGVGIEPAWPGAALVTASDGFVSCRMPLDAVGEVFWVPFPLDVADRVSEMIPAPGRDGGEPPVTFLSDTITGKITVVVETGTGRTATQQFTPGDRFPMVGALIERVMALPSAGAAGVCFDPDHMSKATNAFAVRAVASQRPGDMVEPGLTRIHSAGPHQPIAMTDDSGLAVVVATRQR